MLNFGERAPYQPMDRADRPIPSFASSASSQASSQSGRRARDGGQLVIEHPGEGEQVVALVLQGDAHRADA